jgi:hypothetical protein
LGILRRMANMIVALKDAKPQMFELIKDHLEKTSWQDFVEHELAEANDLEKTSLAIQDLRLPSQSMDDDSNAMMFNGNTFADHNLHENVGIMIVHRSILCPLVILVTHIPFSLLPFFFLLSHTPTLSV